MAEQTSVTGTYGSSIDFVVPISRLFSWRGIWLDEGFLRRTLVVGPVRFEVSRSQYSKRYAFKVVV